MRVSSSTHCIPLGRPLTPLSAAFCKHIFVPNFVAGLKAPTVRLTDETRQLVRSDYQARTEKELPVLARWIPGDTLGERPDATWLDLILYSKEQIVAENRAMGNDQDDTSGEDYDWGIISIKVGCAEFGGGFLFAFYSCLPFFCPFCRPRMRIENYQCSRLQS